jgi:putative membrane protein
LHYVPQDYHQNKHATIFREISQTIKSVEKDYKNQEREGLYLLQTTIMGFIIKILIIAVAAYFAAWLLPGIDITGLKSALIVALVFALLNTFVKPILVLLTIPITIITLGLFLLVINIIIVYLTAYFVDGFTVNGILSALLFSLIVSVVSSILESIAGVD